MSCCGSSVRPRTLARIALTAAVAFAAPGAVTVAAKAVPAARPGSVFDASRSLAIEAARARLALFVAANPLSAEDVAAAPPSAACPLGGADALANAGRARGMEFQLDPWAGSTTSDPELRPASVPVGTVQGIPIVRCTTNRPADGQVTRPALFAISLVDGVSFGDVARLHAIDPILRVRPAGIAGEMAGACLGTADTEACVVLWQSRNLLLAITLEGPPSTVNTGTAGTLLTDLVPDVVDSLAVVQRPPSVCSGDSLRADTGVVLIAEPTCHDGWAVGASVECPPEDPSTTTTTPVGPPCEAIRDVFHVESNGWRHNGPIDVRCAETLAELGMTPVTAQQFAPACNANDPALRIGTLRPNATGAQVAALQIALVNVGYDLQVDGRYGPITEAAIVDFQIDNGLTVDGITGRQTRGALGI